MRLVFDACVPRPEVLQGKLTEDIFAARLKDVLDGVAAPVYQNPETFFANTYPTAGLRLLLSEALGRLTGVHPTNSPILRLETAFGGGKTHNLIALYHIARGGANAAMLQDVVDAAWLHTQVSGDTIYVWAETTGLPVETYTATVTVTADPGVLDSPQQIPVTLHVVEQLYTTYLPLVLRVAYP